MSETPAVVLPMFPLGTVLLPGMVLPLRVFEPRYRALVQHCAEHDPEFGVVLISRGHEVGGGDERTDSGTVARIAEVAGLAGGGYALVAIGQRRIRVNRWLPDDPYPQALVEPWPDAAVVVGDGNLGDAIALSKARLDALLELATAAGYDIGTRSAELPADPVWASYHLAALAPVGPADRQRLLTAPGPVERLARLHDLLDDAEAVIRFQMQTGAGS